MSSRWAIVLMMASGCSSSKPASQRQLDASTATTAALGTVAEITTPATENDDELPVVDCPVGALDGEALELTVDRLLEQATASFDDQRLAEAWTCADEAADLSPQSVEAHHLRATALAALGHDAEAELAYTMALALDPEDPETLRAVADFYLNVRIARGRDTAQVALELAQRGQARAAARRRGSAGLRAELALLSAQALNDLSRSDEALDDAREALRLQPSLIDAVHERGVALYNLGRFGEARTAFTDVLGQLPDDAYAHHFLGLTLEQLGAGADAQAHFERARTLEPDDFPPPVLIPLAEFQAEVDAIVAELPESTRLKLADVPIEVVDVPAREDLEAVEPPFPPNILGLFRGMPHGLDERSESSGVGSQPAPPGGRGRSPLGKEPQQRVAGVPRAIMLYRVNLARAVRTREELSEQIRRTLLHEIGHLEGLDEDDLRRRGLD